MQVLLLLLQNFRFNCQTATKQASYRLSLRAFVGVFRLQVIMLPAFSLPLSLSAALRANFEATTVYDEHLICIQIANVMSIAANFAQQPNKRPCTHTESHTNTHTHTQAFINAHILFYVCCKYYIGQQSVGSTEMQLHKCIYCMRLNVGNRCAFAGCNGEIIKFESTT